MEIENILKIIDKISEKEINYFSYEENEEKLVIKSNNEKYVSVSPEANYIQTGKNDTNALDLESVQIEDSSLNKINSPIVGTYYSSSTEGGEPFIKVGDTVKKGQIIGIIEAMKIMNDIESPFDGIVESVDVENGQMVEYGQLLCQIK